MSCWNKRRWYVENATGNKVWGYDKDCNLGWIDNTPWVKPFLFSSLNLARKISLKRQGMPRHWSGKVYPNTCK